MAVHAATQHLAGGSLWTNQNFRAVVFQAFAIALLGALIWFLAHNTAENLAARNIASGFGFLEVPAGFDIATTLVPYASTSTYGRALFAGFLNTVLVSALGIVMATIIGFIVGILRLSPNWLMSKIAYVYVEMIRNVPLLLQILFWWGVFLNLPRVRNAQDIGWGFFLSNRGFQAPSPIFEAGAWLIPTALLIGIGGTIIYSRWAKKKQEATGEQSPVLWVGLGLIIGLPVFAGIATGMPISWELPVKRGFNFAGGFTITPEFVAVWVALSTYTAGFIAEIVRAGIEAVPHGQTEAAASVGLKPRRVTQLVIIPQAMRVIVPPLSSQYLNLTKNSSLALAVGYPDLVGVGETTLNQTGQAIEIIAIIMAVYLSLSLLISAFMNWYNRRIALVER